MVRGGNCEELGRLGHPGRGVGVGTRKGGQMASNLASQVVHSGGSSHDDGKQWKLEEVSSFQVIEKVSFGKGWGPEKREIAKRIHEYAGRPTAMWNRSWDVKHEYGRIPYQID